MTIEKFKISSLNGDRKMFDALTYQEMLKEIKKNSEKYGITDDVVAILITRPDLATGKDILNSLEYYHFRTGHSINFYLPGYGAYWTEEEYPDGKVVKVFTCRSYWSHRCRSVYGKNRCASVFQ